MHRGNCLCGLNVIQALLDCWNQTMPFHFFSFFQPVKACYQFALTIQECMTNEGALEHYNFDETKVKRNFQSATSKKPLRGKPASDKSLWTDEEEQALVVFILNWQIKQKPKMIRSKPATPRRKARAASSDESKGDFRIMPAKSELWDDCAKFISRKACLPKRTGQYTLVFNCQVFWHDLRQKCWR